MWLKFWASEAQITSLDPLGAYVHKFGSIVTKMGKAFPVIFKVDEYNSNLEQGRLYNMYEV